MRLSRQALPLVDELAGEFSLLLLDEGNACRRSLNFELERIDLVASAVFSCSPPGSSAPPTSTGGCAGYGVCRLPSVTCCGE